MKTDTTEIRRIANGSIDTDHYIRNCHRERSLAAHRAFERIFNMPRERIQDFFLRWSNRAPVGNAPEPAE
jgi:hypothetical protein